LKKGKDQRSQIANKDVRFFKNMMLKVELQFYQTLNCIFKIVIFQAAKPITDFECLDWNEIDTNYYANVWFDLKWD
jgi:hypothetical protein